MDKLGNEVRILYKNGLFQSILFAVFAIGFRLFAIIVK